jgi:predicted transcriptional regulator
MKSVRIDPETEEQLETAAKARGVSESEFIRQAIRKEAQVALGEMLEARLGDVVGIIRSKGGRARESHAHFSKLVKKESKRRRS